MLSDASQGNDGRAIEADVCIVGTGPAGLTLARELSRAGQRVCLLEAGGKKMAEPTQDFNAGCVNSAHGYRANVLRDGRRRQMGGSANLWNHELRGETARHVRYVELDAIDLERRDWIPESGWPITRVELQSHYDRAAELCGVAQFRKDASEWATPGRVPWESQRIESVVSQFGSSTVFLEKIRSELERNESVTILLHAPVRTLQMEPLARRIVSATVGKPGAPAIEVRAGRFVLAAGGLENARLLLLQEHLQPGGLGNQNDMVGRCFMDHPSITLGTLKPHSTQIFSQAGFYDQHAVDGHPIMGKLHIRPEIMRREKMLNLCAVLVPHFKNLRSNLPAVLRQLAAKGPKFLWQRRGIAEHCYSPQAGGEAPQSFRQRLLEGYYSECYCGWSRLPARHFGEFGVRSLVEQSPDRSNRILLGNDTDALGQRRIEVRWKWNALDLHSIARAQEIFREDLAAASIGDFTPEAEGPENQPRFFYSPHHFMGTTRMHIDPRQGVVDADCRVHDVANLYVAGSSLFPTGGFANPTFTLLALALRLANHLIAQTRPAVFAQSDMTATPVEGRLLHSQPACA